MDDLGPIGSLFFLLALDQGVVEEVGTAFRGSSIGSGRKYSPCPAAAGVFWSSGKWTLLEKRVDSGSDGHLADILEGIEARPEWL